MSLLISEFINQRVDMYENEARQDRVGSVLWWVALAVALSALLNIGVCSAEQLKADSTTQACVETAAPQPQAPIDATMMRLRQFENVVGFDPARLSAAGRNLFSLADRWAVLRERLIKGAPAPAQGTQSRAVEAAQTADSCDQYHQFALFRFHPESNGDRLVWQRRRDGFQ